MRPLFEKNFLDLHKLNKYKFEQVQEINSYVFDQFEFGYYSISPNLNRV